jgi:hypothetical protein
MGKNYISNLVDLSRAKTDKLNIIDSGCGTGKTYFVEKYLLSNLHEKLPGVFQEPIKPEEVIFLTSRSMIVDQQAANFSDQVEKFNPYNLNMIRYWNGEILNAKSILNAEYESTDEEAVDGSSYHVGYFTGNGIQVMTYDKLIYILNYCNNPDRDTLGEIKVIILDECHTLLSDTFIRGINVLKVWMREKIRHNEKLFIGMTATPTILYESERSLGFRINKLNDTPILNYKVKNLHCTSFKMLPSLFNNGMLSGKSLVMCYSVNDCIKLSQEVKNSAVLVSRNHEKYSKEEMEYIRNYIVTNNSLPASNGLKDAPLDVLITTSTLREGINLTEDSGIKNVICCIPDELHISQFVGRCRFDIENLIIANEFIQVTKATHPYLRRCREEFQEFLKDQRNDAWLNSISHLLEEGCKPKFFAINRYSFKKYLNENWADTGKKIYTEEDKNEILKVGISCKILNSKPSQTTFNGVIKYVADELGYEVITGRIPVDGKLVTYKEIRKK